MFGKNCLATLLRPSSLFGLWLAAFMVAIPAWGPAEIASLPKPLDVSAASATISGSGSKGNAARQSSDSWSTMPSGARPAYIGIHGGTVPVSLLTSKGGSTMIALVGETGSDFLRVLRGSNASTPVEVAPQVAQASELPASPATASATATVAHEGVPPATALPDPGANGTLLFAATASGNVPVIYTTGRSFEDMDITSTKWTPFGLDEQTVKAETQTSVPKAKKAKSAKQRKAAASSRRTLKTEAERAPRILHHEGGPVSITAPGSWVAA